MHAPSVPTGLSLPPPVSGWAAEAWSGAVRVGAGAGWQDAPVDAALRAQGDAMLSGLDAARPGPSLSTAERERLEALGYIDLTPGSPASGATGGDTPVDPAVRDAIPAR
jgi:hypothetical protein